MSADPPRPRYGSSVERAPDAAAAFDVREEADETAVLTVSGTWRLGSPVPAATEARRRLGGARRLRLAAGELGPWDTSLLTFVLHLEQVCAAGGIEVDRAELPAGARRLIELAEEIPEKEGARKSDRRGGWVERIGTRTLVAMRDAGDFLEFLGETAMAGWSLVRGRARVRGDDFMVQMQRCGADALPIVTLISFLVGTILAFVGAVQLEKFGATIYVADLVGIAMVRELGAMMTGIVMAGRTGAAFAAEIGTMKVTQEIDALQTMGISPTEFLVLPRTLALMLMMPLLCLYADLVGVLGGLAIGTWMLGIPAMTYYNETCYAVTTGHLLGGVFKASVYGVLVAVAGCLNGMQCGKSSAAVGNAATSAVVSGIVLIIAACGIFAVLFYLLGL